MKYIQSRCEDPVRMKKDEYRTKDIGEASAIAASNIKLLRLDREGGFFWFVFEDINTSKVADSYWSGDLVISAREYNISFQTLKDRIFARRGWGNG